MLSLGCYDAIEAAWRSDGCHGKCEKMYTLWPAVRILNLSMYSTWYMIGRAKQHVVGCPIGDTITHCFWDQIFLVTCLHME